MRNNRILFSFIKRNYDQKVIDYFENPPNVGSLDKKMSSVGSGNLTSNCRVGFLWRLIKVSDQC